MELIEHEGVNYADARMLYNWLGIKKDFSTWVKYNIERALLSDDDFYTFRGESTGGRPSIEYWLKKDAALDFCIISGGENAKKVRDEIKKSFEEKQTGISLNVDQISALHDVVKAMTLVSIQNEVARKHFDFKNFGKHSDWWKYRSELLGYSVQSLKEALAKIGKKYSSQKKALMHIDPAEIIRTGVIDLLITLGRNEEYAINVAEFAKVIAEKNGYHYKIWDDTKPNPLGLGMKDIIERQEMGNKILNHGLNRPHRPIQGP